MNVSKPAILLIQLLTYAIWLNAQSLTFTPPQMLLSNAVTDKAIDITNFKGRFFVTWKETGSAGKPHVAYLGGGGRHTSETAGGKSDPHFRTLSPA